jgi:hydrogenase maturation protein HypF
VAPRNPHLGVMLPYTPLHHLLLRAAGGIPLVMTSGNRSDEPIAYRDDEALAKLAGIADLFLVHNRPIHVRCDDSVTRVVDGVELPVRRSRGHAPRPIELPSTCPRPLLAVGGQLKATFALGRGRQAFLSHHLGDLDHYEAYRAFEKDVALYEELFGVRPEILAQDLHPDYATSRYAHERAAREGTELLAVQHHHAHMAACMAEHGLPGPVLGVSFDGTGYGTDGAVWGGEFLVGDCKNYHRAAHLRYVGLPGGDQAIREPWRMALAHLADAGVELPPLTARLLPAYVRTVQRMVARRFNTPLTSSAGRLFDAVACLAGVRDRVSYEGQAAMELEWLATGAAPDYSYPYQFDSPRDGVMSGTPVVVDTRPLIRAVAEEVSQGVGAALVARRFHSTLVDLIAAVCGLLRQVTGVGVVVLSGGVFQSALLTSEVGARLEADGFRVYRHRLVPPGDGGLSLGQLAVAAARLS